VAPFVTPADVAVKAVGIDVERIALIVAIDVATQSVTDQTAEQHTTNHRTAVPVTDGTTIKPPPIAAEHCAAPHCRVCIAFIVAFAMTAGGPSVVPVIHRRWRVPLLS